MAQFHDLGPEVAHSGGGASVLGPGLGIAGPVHVRLALYFIYPQGVDNDVDVSKLKIMKSAHQSKQFQLEDNLLKHFPEQIKTNEGLRRYP